MAPPPTVGEDSEEGDRERYMTIGEHLEELRRRLIGMVVVTVLVAIVAGVFIYPLHEQLLQPYVRVTEASKPGGLSLILRQVPGPLVTLLKLALMMGFSAALPINISILWGFLSPAVSRRSAWLGHGVVLASALLFWSGAFVCWRFIFPVALQFMLIDLLPAYVTPQLTLEDYYAFLFFVHIGAGLGFQLPLVVVVLGALGIVRLAWHAQAWKYIVTATFVFAALVTPPDPVTQLILAGFLVGLYGISVGIVWIVERTARRGS